MFIETSAKGGYNIKVGTRQCCPPDCLRVPFFFLKQAGACLHGVGMADR